MKMEKPEDVASTPPIELLAPSMTQNLSSLHTDTAYIECDEELLARGTQSSWTSQFSISSPVAQFQELTNRRQKARVLNIWLVLPIYYFLSCGGPTGIEPAISSGGPLPGIITLLAFPICFSLPLAMVVSELCTAFPDDGGYVIWVKNAFGIFWGFQQGYWAWVSNVLCIAACPGLVLAALATTWGSIASPVVEYIVKVMIALVLSIPTLCGARVVGKISCALTVVVLVPVIVLTIWCFAKAHDYDRLGQVRRKRSSNKTEIDFTTLITTVFWSYDGIYIVSLFGSLVSNPAYTYPRAIFVNLGAMVLTYVIPMLAIVAVGKVQWTDFSIEQVGQLMGGRYLHGAQVLALICSNAGLFMTTNFATCYQIVGMAENDLIPSLFSTKHVFFETPHFALILNVFPALFVMAFDFKVLTQTANCFSAAVQIFIILSALRLRMHKGTHIHRPSRVPGGLVFLLALMIVPFLVLGFVVVTAFSSVVSGIISAAFVIVGMAAGILWVRRTPSTAPRPPFASL